MHWFLLYSPTASSVFILVLKCSFFFWMWTYFLRVSITELIAGPKLLIICITPRWVDCWLKLNILHPDCLGFIFSIATPFGTFDKVTSSSLNFFGKNISLSLPIPRSIYSMSSYTLALAIAFAILPPSLVLQLDIQHHQHIQHLSFCSWKNLLQLTRLP